MSGPRGAVLARRRITYDPFTSVPWRYYHETDRPAMVARAYAADAAVDTWPDETANGRTLTGPAGVRPTWKPNTLNGKATVRFAGAHEMSHVLANVVQPGTVVAVFTQDALTEGTSQVVWDAPTTPAPNRNAFLTYTTPNPDTWWIYGGTGTINGSAVTLGAHLVIAEYNGATSKLLIDGVQVASGNAGAHQHPGLKLGRNFNSILPWWGSMAMVAMVPAVLSDDEKNSILSWARSKYATP